MDAIPLGKLKPENSSLSLQRLGKRTNRPLLQSELAAFDAGTAVAYTRLSHSPSCGYGDQIKLKSRALDFLLKVFSLNFMGCGGGAAVQVEAADQKKQKKKTQPPWIPDPNRRWPVQGW